jgi:hypothetical protein
MKIITNLIFLILLLPAFSQAATYCIHKSHSIFKAKKQVDFILLKDESVLIDSRNNCLTIAVKDYRKPLVDKFINMNFKIMSRPNSAYVQRRSCKVKVKKVRDNKLNGQGVTLGKKIDIRDSISDLQGSTSMQMLLMEGRQGRLSVDSASLSMVCRIVTGGHELTFSLENNGSTQISTQAFISRGQWLNVGQITKDLKNKRNNKSLSDGIDYNKADGKETTTYFVTVVE